MAENDLDNLAQRVRDDEVAEFALMLIYTADPNLVISAGESTLLWDRVNDDFYTNSDGATAWQFIGGGSGAAAHDLLSATHTDTVANAPT